MDLFSPLSGFFEEERTGGCCKPPFPASRPPPWSNGSNSSAIMSGWWRRECPTVCAFMDRKAAWENRGQCWQRSRRSGSDRSF